MGGEGWRGVGVRKRELSRSIRCGCEKRSIIEHLPRKLSRVCSQFLRREVHSRKCERRARARGMARSIIRIVKIRCRKYFVRLIFVALCDYENFPIYGICEVSSRTLFQLSNSLTGQSECGLSIINLIIIHLHNSIHTHALTAKNNGMNFIPLIIIPKTVWSSYQKVV